MRRAGQAAVEQREPVAQPLQRRALPGPVDPVLVAFDRRTALVARRRPVRRRLAVARSNPKPSGLRRLYRRRQRHCKLSACRVRPVAHLHRQLVHAVPVRIPRRVQRARHRQAQRPVPAQREQLPVLASDQTPAQRVPVGVPRPQPPDRNPPDERLERAGRDHRRVVVVDNRHRRAGRVLGERHECRQTGPALHEEAERLVFLHQCVGDDRGRHTPSGDVAPALELEVVRHDAQPFG